MDLNQHKEAGKGFTIVELLIVVVVIAILAGIVIVSYNGVRNSSISAVLQSNLQSGLKVLLADYGISGTYPGSLSSANQGKGINLSEEGVSYNYMSRGNSFCLGARSSNNPDIAYKVDESGAITEGECLSSKDTVFVFDTEACGTDTVRLPISQAQTTGSKLDWGDGSPVEQFHSNESRRIHTYDEPGTYTVTYEGSISQVDYGGSGYWRNACLTDVLQWGEYARPTKVNFIVTPHLKYVAPIPTSVADISGIFDRSGFDSDISNWDVSNVVNMDRAFFETEKFNQSLNSWDVSNVKTMRNMFGKSKSFNGSIDKWDVSGVTDMSEMFKSSHSFNKPLNSWDVSSVTLMDDMFYGAKAFNQRIDDWDLSSLTSMGRMFSQTESFNQPMINWDISNVTSLNGLFSGAQAFNQPVGSWDVSHITNMEGVFLSTGAFNQPLSGWDVSNVKTMVSMFAATEVFNQDISGWDVSGVTDMFRMFQHSKSFNQNLSGWDVANVTNSNQYAYGVTESRWPKARHPQF